MNERQHHLNESSSARTGGSQQLEILLSPNSKRLYFGKAPIFWKSAYILEKRLYFGKAPIFWESAYILSKRLYFEQAPIYFEKAPIFWASANILWMCWYFGQAPIFYDFAWFCCCKYLCIFSVFIYAFCMPQYFWRNCFEA
jgi:hypothetical protein